jgi:hypothetical protein
VPSGSLGWILDGPVDRDFNGSPATWWQVRFDASVEGWVQQTLLTPANETLVRKEARVCLPPAFNPYLGGTATPSLSDLQGLCAVDVADEAQATVNQELAPLGRFLCQCEAQSALLAANYDASCGEPCPDGADVCLVAGSDPPDPIPDPMSAALLQPTTVCEMEGGLELLIDGRTPKTQPSVRGTLEVHGRPCSPGEDCSVGMFYQMTGDDIEFDSGSIFASDPKFVDLGVSGATVPGVVDMGLLLGFYLGEVPPDTAFSTAQGRRSTSPVAFSITGRNTEGVALAMNWENKTCRLSGELVGAAVEGDGEEGTLDVQGEIELDGIAVNQPPAPDAGPDQTVECTSPAGAGVTLDGSGTTDADANLAFVVWRRGAPDGAQLAAPSTNPVLQTQQALGQESYFLQAVDDRFAADHDGVQVSVADTTAPSIACNAPSTIYPSDVPEKRNEGISFTATADDGCTGISALAIQDFTCTKPASCRVGFDGATLTIYDSGGIGDTIRWNVAAVDGAGNESITTCGLNVVKNK